MAFYDRMQALADRQIAAKGLSVTIRAEPTPNDPVTGAAVASGELLLEDGLTALLLEDGATALLVEGAAAAADRTMNAVLTGVDNKTFPDTLVEAGDRMLLTDAEIEVGEIWVDGADLWRVVAVKKIIPDNSTYLASKALIRG